ncbi:MAG TPA: hypothetical protein ACFYED_00095 [Candidatus Tripitaka californicus]|uniref:hypothetical protein n=1 Tax=Candidatus Tripitaka californicus TaxID=3367616 RepID=UPI00402A4503
MELDTVRAQLKGQAEYSVNTLREMLLSTIYPTFVTGVGGRSIRQGTDWQSRMSIMFRHISSLCEVADDLPDLGSLAPSTHGIVPVIRAQTHDGSEGL